MHALISRHDVEQAQRGRRRRIGSAEVQQRGALQHWKCKMCDRVFTGPFQIDHLIPFCLVGERSPLFALCGTCHDLKSRMEAKKIQRVRSLASSLGHNTYRVCYLCEHVVSQYFHHQCTINLADPYASVRVSSYPTLGAQSKLRVHDDCQTNAMQKTFYVASS